MWQQLEYLVTTTDLRPLAQEKYEFQSLFAVPSWLPPFEEQWKMRVHAEDNLMQPHFAWVKVILPDFVPPESEFSSKSRVYQCPC